MAKQSDALLIKSNAKAAIHMVGAFSAANGVVLGQVKADAKSNEITAIPELLQLLEIKCCLVSIDAMGCQRNIADKIVKKEGDYLLAVKGNQPKLQAAFEKHFPISKLYQYDGDSFETKEKPMGALSTGCTSLMISLKSLWISVLNGPH